MHHASSIMNYRLLSILCLAMSFQNVFAQLSIRGSGPDIVEEGEKFRVQYTVNTQEASEPEWPSFTGFEVLFGPRTSSQSSVQIINGKMSSSSSITYTFVLTADKAGTYTIPAVSVECDGKTAHSQPITIRVVSGGSASHQRQQNQQPTNQQQPTTNNQRPTTKGNGKDLFMTATANRTNVFEQEAVLITFKVYTQVNLTKLDGKLPSLNGFQIQEIPLSRDKTFEYEVYNGQRYNSVVWAQYVVFPQKSGDLVIPSVTYEATEARVNRAMNPIDAFFNGVSTTEVKRNITTPQVTIHVSPLPAKPDKFSGAVGQFSLSSAISAETVKANDALTLRLKIKGTGNMKLINTPEIAFPKDFERYDPKVNDNFSLTRNGLNGSKEFEYLVVPRHKGTYTIPSADFVYFDTQSHSYKTLHTDSYTINVERGTETQNSSVSFADNQQQVEQLGTDIRYIKTGDVNLREQGETLFTSWKYWIWYLLLTLVAVVVAALGRKRIRDNANISKTKGKKANKEANKRLKKAARLLKQHDAENFYDEIMRALLGYTADKLTIPLASLNKDNIQTELQKRNVSQSLIDLFMKCLNDSEFARYAPGDPDETMENVYKGAVSAITNMESSIRKAKNSLRNNLSLILLFLSLSVSSYAAPSSKQVADSLYAQEDYEKAALVYEDILAHQGTAPEIYYNLAGCYFKLDDIAHAILNYERAHLLDPSDSAIKENLAFARGRTADKLTPPSELFFVTWWRDMTNWLSIDSWLILALVTFLLLLSALLSYAFSSQMFIKRIGAYGAIIVFIVTTCSLLAALSQYRQLTDHDYAIILSPAVTVQSTPSEGSTDLFIIHEGAKVRILDSSMKDWAEVKLEEGKQGWIEKSSFEII